MFEVKECDNEAKRLINVTELCLKTAIDICKPNENFCSIGNYHNNNAEKDVYVFSFYYRKYY